MKILKKMTCIIMLIILFVTLNSNTCLAGSDFDNYTGHNGYDDRELKRINPQNGKAEYVTDNYEKKLVCYMADYLNSLNDEFDDGILTNKLKDKLKETECSETYLNRLLANYNYYVRIWSGGELDTPARKAVEARIQEIKTGQDVDIPSDEETNDIYQQIINLRNQIGNLNNATLDQLKQLDNLYKKLLNTGLGGDLRDQMRYLSNLIKAQDESYQTAYDQLGERENQNNGEGQHGVLGNPNNASSNHTVDEIMNEAEKFLNIGKNNGSKIDSNNLKDASDTLYNVLLGLGIALTIGIGMYLGVKFMLSSAEDKAKVKESLIPYIAGCIVIFGAFTIWKLAITLFGQVEQIASTHTSDSSYIALQNEQIKS